MGLYGDQILPRAIDLALRGGVFAGPRARAAAGLEGEVAHPAPVPRVRRLSPWPPDRSAGGRGRAWDDPAGYLLHERPAGARVYLRRRRGQAV